MTEFEIAQIAVQIYIHLPTSHYKHCVEVVKKAHGIQLNEVEPTESVLVWCVACKSHRLDLIRYGEMEHKKGYGEGYKKGFEDGQKSQLKVSPWINSSPANWPADIPPGGIKPYCSPITSKTE